jgi:hypothetical protein
MTTMKLFLAEKPSQARSISTFLNATRKREGHFEGALLSPGHLAMSQIAAYQHPNESVTNRMTDQNMAVDDLDAFAIIVYIRGYTQRLV